MHHLLFMGIFPVSGIALTSQRVLNDQGVKWGQTRVYDHRHSSHWACTPGPGMLANAANLIRYLLAGGDFRFSYELAPQGP
jgi:hypothetical protein